MGAGNAGSTGGGGGVGPAGVTYKTVGTNRKTVKQYGTVADAKQTSKRYEFRESGARKIDKQKIGAFSILKEPFKAGSRITRDFFTDKVLTSKRGFKGMNKRQFESLSIAKQNEIYSGYLSDRSSSKIDAYGNTLSGGGNDNTPAQTIIKKTAGGQTVQTTAPTEAELSQSAAADAEAYDLRKTKKRGRSITTLTSSKGLTDDKLTLGKPSLLGA